MSPLPVIGLRDREGFPRVSGDEPSELWTQSIAAWFSPRERG